MSAKAKARLTNIDVLEVSVVDAAANKRQWLITKRDTPPGEEMTAELLKKLEAFLATAQNTPPPVQVDKAAFDKAVEDVKSLTAKLEELTKAVGELKTTVTSQAETISKQATALEAATKAATETDKTVAELRKTANEQAEIIRNARLHKVSNASDDDPQPGFRPAGGATVWPKDLNADRERRKS